MRERAEELGGSCVIGRRAEGGTQMVALLPLELKLNYGKFCILAFVRCMKSEDNILSRYASFEQALGNWLIRSVFLNVNFVVLNTQMINRAMHPPPAVPANIHQLVTAMFIIKDKEWLNIAM